MATSHFFYHFKSINCINWHGQKFLPSLFVKDITEWHIPDPKDKSLEEVRKIRDQIDAKIKELTTSI